MKKKALAFLWLILFLGSTCTLAQAGSIRVYRDNFHHHLSHSVPFRGPADYTRTWPSPPAKDSFCL